MSSIYIRKSRKELEHSYNNRRFILIPYVAISAIASIDNVLSASSFYSDSIATIATKHSLSEHREF